MHRKLLYVAYGLLLLGGILHFGIDVVSQYFRGKRAPGPEATLYYGLNTAYALGHHNTIQSQLLRRQKMTEVLFACFDQSSLRSENLTL